MAVATNAGRLCAMASHNSPLPEGIALGARSDEAWPDVVVALSAAARGFCDASAAMCGWCPTPGAEPGVPRGRSGAAAGAQAVAVVRIRGLRAEFGGALGAVRGSSGGAGERAGRAVAGRASLSVMGVTVIPGPGSRSNSSRRRMAASWRARSASSGLGSERATERMHFRLKKVSRHCPSVTRESGQAPSGRRRSRPLARFQRNRVRNELTRCRLFHRATGTQAEFTRFAVTVKGNLGRCVK